MPGSESWRAGASSEVVAEARDFIVESGFEATAEGIRASRTALVGRFRDHARGPETWRDFFSMEECRDLVFHVQEHRFTLRGIQRILDELNLEFLCFELLEQETHDAFRERFPEPASKRSLSDWHAVETDRPSTFAAMYQFWVRKPA